MDAREERQILRALKLNASNCNECAKMLKRTIELHSYMNQFQSVFFNQGSIRICLTLIIRHNHDKIKIDSLRPWAESFYLWISSTLWHQKCRTDKRQTDYGVDYTEEEKLPNEHYFILQPLLDYTISGTNLIIFNPEQENDQGLSERLNQQIQFETHHWDRTDELG